MNEIFKIYGSILLQDEAFVKGLKGALEKAEDTTSQLAQKFEQVGQAFNKVGQGMSKVGTTLTATLTTGIVGLTAAGIKYNMQMENFQMNLTTLLGSSEKATKLLNDLKEMAATTPFETDDLISATQTMIGFGISANDAQKYLGMIGDIAMGDANKLSGLSLAFSQVQSTGKLTGQDLLQMVNQGFNPLKYISEMTGKSMAQLKEEMAEGAISAEDVAKAFEYATSKGQPFYKGMENGATTVSGRISTLKDNFQILIGNLTESLLPTFSKIIDKLTELTEKFTNLSDEQKEQILKWGAIVASIGPVLIILGKLITAFGSVYTVIGKLKAVGGLAGLITKFKTFFPIIASGIGTMTGIIAVFGLLVVALGGPKEALDKLKTAFQYVKDKVVELGEYISTAFSPVIEHAKDTFDKLVGALSPLVTYLIDLITKFTESKLVSDLLKGAIDLLAGTFDTLLSAVDFVIDTIKDCIDWLKEHEQIAVLLGIAIGGLTAAITAYKVAQALANAGGITHLATMALQKASTIAMTVATNAHTLATTLATTATSAFGAVMAFITSPITLVIAAIAALVAGIYLLIKNWDTVKETASNVWEWIKDVWGKVADWFDTKVIQPLIKFFTNLWDGIKKVWDGICLAIEIAIKVIASIFDAALQIILLPFTFIWENCKDVILGFIDGAKEVIGNVVTWIVNKFNDLKLKVTYVWSLIKTYIIQPIVDVYNRIKEVIGQVVSWIVNKFNELKAKIEFAWNLIKAVFTSAVQAVVNFVKERFETLKNNVTTIFNAIKEFVQKVWEGIKNYIINPIKNAYDKVKETVTNLKDKVVDTFNNVKDKVTNVFNKVKEAITKPIENAKDKVKDIVDKMKGFFDFDFKLPKIKLPHFGIKPKGWKLKDLLEGEIPKLSIDWYAKGGIFDKPTIFPTASGMKGVGEAGPEAVTPISALQKYVQVAVENSNNGLEERLDILTNVLLSYLPLLTERQIVMDTGQLVGSLVNPMDKALGDKSKDRRRGR